MGTRRKSRELALQMLFQSDMGRQNFDHVRRTFWAEHSDVSDDVRNFADDLFRLAVERADEVDKLAETLLVESSAAVLIGQYALERRVVALDSSHRVVHELADGGLLSLGLQVRPASTCRARR